MQKQKMTNIQKYQLVKELSPVYSANEIAELTGLTPSSIYHFRRKYQLETEKDSDHLETAVLDASIKELSRKRMAVELARLSLDE